MALKENYKDDILDVSVNTKRKYRMTENQDGTISLEDETVYTQEGDSFGASDLNAMAHAINNTSSDAEHTSYDNTESGLISDNVQDAIDEVVEEFEQTPITVGGETLSTIDDKLNWLIGHDYNLTMISYSNNPTSSPVTIPLISSNKYLLFVSGYNIASYVGKIENNLLTAINDYTTPDSKRIYVSISNDTLTISGGSNANNRYVYTLLQI
jgi:hypothetical protein